MKFRSALILLPLLAACSSGPDFAPPPRAEAPLPAEWWRQFQSPALDRVIDLALASNHSLAAANARIEQARQLAAAVEGGLAPQIGAGVDAGRQRYGVALFGPSNFKIPPFNYYEAGASLAYDLDLFGGQKRAAERQRALVDYQREEWVGMRLDLVADAAAAAVAIAGARAQAALAEAVAADDERNLELVRVAAEAGAMTETDLVAAESRLAADRALLPPLRQRLAAARHALAILAGKSPREWTPPDFTLSGFALPRSLPDSLPSELAEGRPDIRAAEAELHAATAAVGMAEASRYPRITLSASATLESLQPQNLFEFGNAASSLLGSVTQTAFDGGTLKAQQLSAEAALEAQREIYRQTVLNAFGQVADALQMIANDSEAWALKTRAEALAQRALALSRQERDAGNSGLLQLLSAERAAHLAQFDRTGAEIQRLLDAVALCRALGGAPIPPSGSRARD
jgi:NodT family efflux transporter outer membrane factor (OMF) lipoprotein